jgi:two-component system chemotaxis response regulator CheY
LPFKLNALLGLPRLRHGSHMSAVASKERVCRVLIIEDDQDDVFLLERALDKAQRVLSRKIETQHVDNGQDAVFLVSREDQTDTLPDALILDLNMPKLDGIQFLRSLRKSLLLKDLPVFVLTTTTAPAIHAEAIRAGADNVFLKPNDAEALHAIATEIVVATIDKQTCV